MPGYPGGSLYFQNGKLPLTPYPIPFRLRDRLSRDRLGWGLDSTVNVKEPHRPAN